MSSRRRNSKNNLGNSISDIQRRIRRMERKPIRTRLQNRVIKGSAIAPSTITAEEVDFGTALVTSDNPADVVDNPKDGLLVINPDTNSASVYSETQGDYVDVADPTAQAAALASLQPSANTIVNASNQITAVNTNGITVYSGSSPTTGARIVMNSAGLAGFNSSSTGAGNGATFSISASTGDAIFSGTVNATGGTFTGYVTAGTARFGAAVQTGKNGIYINANNYWYDDATFKVGDGTESMTYTSAGGLVVTGDINATSGTFSGTITATGTISGGTISGATITGSSFTSTNYTGGTGLALAPTGTGNTILFNVSGSQIGSIAAVAGGVVITSGDSSLTMSYAGAVILDGAYNSITLSNAPYLESSGDNTGGGYGSLRNTFASSAAPVSGDGVNGDVWLRWS